jgi:hypothetical protein
VTLDYADFLARKAQLSNAGGFVPTSMPAHLFDYQVSLVEWAVRQGRGGIFADCGLGKTPMELAWAQNVHEHTGKPVLLLTPLAVGFQIVDEAQKFGHDAALSRDGSVTAPITVTNYEQIGKFDSTQFGGVVCDESSAIKSFEGVRRAEVTEFMRRIQYRLLGTATAAPNDYIELGTSSEALGDLGYMDMLTRFFVNDNRSVASRGRTAGGKAIDWRLKGHASGPFWQWVSTWARAMRRPSDYGFSDATHVLPNLIERVTVVEARQSRADTLFDMPAVGLREEREETRRTLTERCETAADLIEPHDISIAWCNLNDEGDLLERLIPNSIQVSGSDSETYKEKAAEWFVGRRCICNEPEFRTKLAKWDGSRNTPREGAQSTGMIPLSEIVAKHKDAPLTKTSPTCASTTEPTPTSSSSPMSNAQNGTGDVVSATPTTKSSETASSNKRGSAVQKSNGTPDSSPSSESPQPSTTSDLLISSGSVQSAEPNALAADGSPSITIIEPGTSAASSAETAISGLVSSATIPSYLTAPGCICGHVSGVRRLITKVRMFGYGLNFQHCAHMTYFPSHSYEQMYQAERRLWRFGQKRDVTVDLITTEGGANVVTNLQRKARQADRMFSELVAHMNDARKLDTHSYDTKIEVPQWLAS